MITTQSLNAALPIADRTVQAKVALGCLESSVLAACVTASANHVVDNYNGDTGFCEAWQESLHASPVFGVKSGITIKQDNGESTIIIPTTIHAQTMDEASTIIADAAKTAMDIALNQAIPAIGTFIDNVNSSLEIDAAFVEPYELIDVGFDKVWDDVTVRGVLDNFSSFTSPKMMMRANIPHVQLPTDYEPEFRTASARVDQMFNELLEEAGLTFIGVIGDLFNGVGDAGAYPAQYWMNPNETLIKFLTAQWLVNNPIPGCGLSSDQWSAVTHGLSNAYGSLAYILRSMFERDIAAKKLYYYYDTVNGKVYLNNVVYDQWLDNGGSPEIIIGAVMSSDFAGLTYDNLLANSAKYMAAWTAHHTALKNASDAKLDAARRDAVFDALLRLVDGLGTDQLPPNANKADLVKRVKSLCAALTRYDLNNLSTTAILLVCNTAFYHTPARDILLNYNSILANGVEEQQAILDAVSDYITDWVTSSVIIANV